MADYNPYASKIRKYKLIGDLFKDFANYGKQNYLINRQRGADERAIAKHGYEMDIYNARLAEYARKTAEHNRLQAAYAEWDNLPASEKAAIEATARGWAPKTRTYSDRSGHGQLSPQGDILTSRTTQQFIPPGQQTYEQAIASIGAGQRMAAQRRKQDLQNAYTMAQTTASNWLSRKRANDIAGAVAGDTVDKGEDFIPTKLHTKSLADAISRQISNLELENEEALTPVEQNSGLENAHRAAQQIAVETGGNLETIVRDILRNVDVFTKTGDERVNTAFFGDGSDYWDFIPKQADAIYSEYKEKILGKQQASGIASGVSPSAEKPNSAVKPGSRDNPILVESKEEEDALEPGTFIRTADGKGGWKLAITE